MSGVMRVHLVHTVDEFEAAIGPPGDPRRDSLRSQLLIDFAFIGAYWTIFATMSALLAVRDFSEAAWLGAIAGECGTVAALLDVSENVNTLRLLGATESGPQNETQHVRNMRRSSLTKWFFAFVTTGFLSIMFFQRGGWFDVLGAAFALTALLGIVTVAGNAFEARLKIGPGVLDVMLRGSFLLMVVVLAVGLPLAAAIA
jgi:hypothetical protein